MKNGPLPFLFFFFSFFHAMQIAPFSQESKRERVKSGLTLGSGKGRVRVTRTKKNQVISIFFVRTSVINKKNKIL